MVTQGQAVSQKNVFTTVLERALLMIMTIAWATPRP
jgi:hypothetical protein